MENHKPNELPGGQQQVAIAWALITHSAVLLADKSTGALDSKTGQEILALFRDLNRQGNTIIPLKKAGIFQAVQPKKFQLILYLVDSLEAVIHPLHS